MLLSSSIVLLANWQAAQQDFSEAIAMLYGSPATLDLPCTQPAAVTEAEKLPKPLQLWWPWRFSWGISLSLKNLQSDSTPAVQYTMIMISAAEVDG